MRVDCTNPDLFGAYRRYLRVGRLFAFLDPRMRLVSGLRWLESLGPWPVILPLSTPRVDLPGLALLPPGLPDLALGVLASDRDLYRPGRDPIRLLLADPLRPLCQVTLQMVRNGVPYHSDNVRLDRHGAGLLVLPPMPEGLYTVSRPDRPANQACTFRVAPHRLAPFTARLVSCEEVPGRPEARDLTLQLERFGQAFQGPLRADLIVQGQRLGQAEHWAEDGRAVFRIPVQRSRSHKLRLQVPDQPECTALVSVTGEDWDGRGRGRLGSVGFGVEGSLHAAPDTHSVRGLYLLQGDQVGPFVLERPASGTARLVARQSVGPVMALLRDPLAAPPLASEDLTDPASWLAAMLLAHGEWEGDREVPGLNGPTRELLDAVEHAKHGRSSEATDLLWSAVRGGADLDHLPAQGRRALEDAVPLAERLLGQREHVEWRDRMEPGDAIEYRVPCPAGVLAVGAWVGGNPWEGWAVCLCPESPPLHLELPMEARPGQEFPLQIDLGDREGSVLVTVRDVRRTASAPLAERLARSLLDLASNMEEVGGSGKHFQEDALERPKPPQRSVPKPLLRASELRSLASAVSVGGVVDLDRLQIDFELSRSIPEHLAQRYKCIPVLVIDNTMVLAIVDPRNEIAIQDMKLITGYNILPVAAREDQVYRVIDRQFGVADLVCVEQTVGEISDDDAGPYSGTSSRLEEEPGKRSSGSGAQFEEVLDLRLLSCVRGKVHLSLRTPEDGGTCEVEALMLSAGDWSRTCATLQVAPGPRPHLRLPAYLRPGEELTGRLELAGNREALQRLELWRDGQPVRFEDLDGALVFPALPGLYRARAVDDTGGAREDLAEVRLVSDRTVRVRNLRWLTRGDRLRREDEGWLEVEELPGVRPLLANLLRALVEYPHGCCEQTAARAAAAAAEWWLHREQPGPRERAERDLRSALARLATMVLSPGHFSLYPGDSNSAHGWLGRATEQHLRGLRFLDSSSVPGDLRSLVVEAQAWTRPDSAGNTAADHYLANREGRNLPADDLADLREQARALAGRSLGGPRERAAAAYIAALLLRTDQEEEDGRLARQLANGVLRGLVDGGRLYSTLDSMAAVALLHEMERAETSPDARWNGDRSEVEVLEGDLVVALLQEEPAQPLAADPLFRARLISGREEVERAAPGVPLDLKVDLVGWYAPGDTMRVSLPEALASLEGGGLIRDLWLDFEGSTSLRVPLVVVGEGDRPIFLRLENMYQEARGGPPVPLPFSASGSASVRLPAITPVSVARPTPQPSPEDLQRKLDELLREGVEGDAAWLHLEPDPVRPRVRLRFAWNRLEALERDVAFRDVLGMVLELRRACGMPLDSEAPGSGGFEWGGHRLECHFMPGFHGLRAAVRLGAGPELGAALEEAESALTSVKEGLRKSHPPDSGRLAQARVSVAAAMVDTDGLSPGDPMRHLLDGLSRLLGVLGDQPTDAARALAFCNHLDSLLRVLRRQRPGTGEFETEGGP